ncbi:AraC family transcriptional regulator [Paenibacillus psychroresistens]|nr:AraC family transcriptional regulator [Paenibacillus psychroresistens]
MLVMLDRLKRHLEDLQLKVTDVGFVRVSAQWKHHNHITLNNCLYYFVEGEGSIQIRDQIFSPLPGQLFLLPAGAMISFSTAANNPFRQYYCHFNAFVGSMPLFQLIDSPLFLQIQDKAKLERLFKKLHRTFKSGDLLAILSVKAIMYELLGFIWMEEKEALKLTTTSFGQRWNDILQYIEEHLMEPISIEHVARHFNYSPKYFFRYFKMTFGVTPHQYIIKLKMERAKQLLLTTDWQVSYIANRVGMERTSFSRFFQKYTNMSPRQFQSSKELN